MKFIFLLFFIVSSSLFSNEELKLTQKQISYLQNTKFNIYVNNWEPFAIVDENKPTPFNIQGIAIDIWKDIADKYNIQYQFIPVKKFTEILSNLKNDKNALALSTNLTTKRKEYAVASIPYNSFSLAIASNSKDSFKTSINEFNGKTIAVGKNFTAHKLLEKYHPKIKLKLVKNSIEALDLLSHDKVDGAADILPVLSYTIQKYHYHNLKINALSKHNYDIQILVNNQNAQIIEIINTYLKTIDKDIINNINTKWLNIKEVIVHKGIDTKYILIVIILFLLAFMFYYIKNQKKYIKKNIQLEEQLRINEEITQDLEQAHTQLSRNHEELETQNKELLQAEQSLKDSIKEYELLFVDAIIPYIVIDNKGFITAYNTKANKDFGLSKYLDKKQLFNILLEEDYSKKFTIFFLNKDFENNHIIIKTNNLDTKEQKRYKLFAKTHPLNDTLTILSFIDIEKELDLTNNLEIKIQEQTSKLLNLNNKYKEAQKVASIGSWSLNLKNNELIWSDEIFNIFNIDNNKFEASYEAFVDAIHPDDREKVNQAYLKSLEDKKPYEIIHRLLLSNGKIKWVEEKCNTKFDDKGKPLISIGTVQDITEKYNSEIKYKSIMDISTDAIHILDLDGNLIEYSQSFADVLGYEMDEIKHFNVSDWDVGIEENKIKNTINDIVLKPKIFDTKHKKKDGTIIDVQINAKAVELFGEKYLYCSQRDITELKAKELLLFEQSKLASLGEMIGNIAHQWRQPLSVISTCASGVKIKKEYGILEDKETDEFLENIIKSTKYLSETISTFGNFIKGSNVKEEHDIYGLLDEAIMIVKDTYANNYINIINNITCQEVCDKKVYLSKHEFSQVIINILNNAKDIIKEREIKNPWIRLEHEVLEDKIIVSIEDNAGGIKEEVLPKIFEPYFTTRHQYQGTGLGLHMSYKIITESINGKIYAQNTKNGAKFFVEIPLSIK